MTGPILNPDVAQRACLLIKKLLKAVECPVCGGTLLTPLAGPCGHGVCARCRSATCPVCEAPTGQVRPVRPLSERAFAVRRLSDAFQNLTGLEVGAGSSSSGIINFTKVEDDSEDWFHKKEKKIIVKKTYGKKNRDSISKLQSVSQQDSALIFPGEDIGSPNISNAEPKPDAVHKVIGWLESSQNVFHVKDVTSVSQVNIPPSPNPVLKVIHNDSYESFFKNKIQDKISKTLDKSETSRNQIDFDEIKVIGSEPLEPSKSELIPLESSIASIDESVSSPGVMKKDDSLLKRFFNTALNKNTAIASNDPCDETNSIQKEDNIIKDKNPWKSVKKMKKVLKKPTRPVLKKLNISVNKSVGLTKDVQSPVIEDVITQNITKQCLPSPEVMRAVKPPPSSVASASICLDSPDIVDKDRAACEEVLMKSAAYRQMHPSHYNNTSAMTSNANDISELPLTHFSPNAKNDVSKVRRIVESIEQKVVVKDILKDFSDNEMSMCTSLKPESVSDEDMSMCASLKPESVHEELDVKVVSLAQRETSYEFNKIATLESTPVQSLQSKPIIESDYEILQSDYKGNKLMPHSSHSRSNSHVTSDSNKIPFYYKSKCNPNISCAEQQDGLNIQITRDNVITTIVVRNQPLVHISGDNQCHVKVARTRDAQTSPIPFYQSQPSQYKCHQEIFTEKPQNMDKQCQTIPLHFEHISAFPAQVSIQNKSCETMKRLEGDVKEVEPHLPMKCPSEILVSTHLQRKSVSKSSGSTVTQLTGNLLPIGEGIQLAHTSSDSSQPLQVTIPTAPPLSNYYPIKKRKTMDSNIEETNSKKIKTKDGFSAVPMDDDLIITFDDSETQKSLKEQSVAHRDQNSETMNYEAIIGTVFANIDKDLNNPKSNQSSNKVNENNDIETPGVARSIDGSSIAIRKDKSSQEHKGNNETDLRNVSMDITHIKSIVTSYAREKDKSSQGNDESNEIDGRNVSQMKDSENMFNTIYEKNTQNMSNFGDPKISARGLQEKTIELSPEEEMLLTPNMKVGTSLCLQQSEEVFTPQIIQDSDDSMVEDTPQKPRKLSILKKGQDKAKLSTEKKSPQSNEPNISQIHPLEVTQIENPLVGSNNSATKTSKNVPTEMTNIGSMKKSETPLSIARFTSDVKFQSTPMQPARRSLNYVEALSEVAEGDEVNDEDNEIGTISDTYHNTHTTSHTNTRGEREFIEEAFGINDVSGRQSAIIGTTSRAHDSQSKHLSKLATKVGKSFSETSQLKNKIICITTSSLPKSQSTAVQEIAKKMGWKYTDKFSLDVTHLIVRTDENNVSVRTVKYVQALAYGLWVVSFNWIVECAKNNKMIKEDDFEVLDSTGVMGPKLSRTATCNLFEGMTFFISTPIATFKESDFLDILRAKGGTIATSIQQVEVRDPKKISIVLGDPQQTQDDQFIDLCLRHPVVPLNVEWAQDSVCCGHLENASNFLLAPRSMLPTVNWPINLIAEDSMEFA